MKRIDLIIDALETGLKLTDGFISEWNQINKALAAARELRDLTPVGYMDSQGVLFNETTHPHLNTALYALDEMTK